MKPFIMTLAAISSVLLFAGCGQSGPLYLPGDPSKFETQPPAEGEEEKEEDSDTAKQPS